nr:synaptobrevin, longin-like domain protein [Tanacetum cinerariifolium]
MIAVLEKYEHNQDFHQIVDFIEASHIRYALTFNHTVYVSYIRQFWSTARIETTEKGTKILATVDGKLRTIFESSIRRNLKLNDKAGISSLPDAKLFKNLTLMGYNISQNQKFTFQKGQFSHQWKYLIQTIMQCLSLKSTGFNEFSSNIATALVCLATNRVYNFSKMIFDGMVRNVNKKVSKFLMQYIRRTRIAQSSVLPPVADEPVSPFGDDSQGEACPTDSGFEADQGRENITKTSTLPSDSTPRLEDREGGDIAPSGEDARIKGRSLDEREEAAIERSTERASDDTDQMVTVLTSLDATTVLTSGVSVSISSITEIPVAEVPTGSGSIPAASPPGTGVPTGSGMVLTASPIFTTATESTPYTRRKGKETMAEFETTKKKKLQEQIDVQVARELEKEMARAAQRMNEQITRDAEISRIHAEEELHMMIDGLDRNNETQRKPLSRKQHRDFYMSVLRSHAGWKAKHFKGMTLEEIKEKFDQVWNQMQYFIPMGSKEEGERFKRKGLRLEKDSAKKELWVELKRMYEPDVEDKLWTHTQNLMHALVEWKLYDMCRVHHKKFPLLVWKVPPAKDKRCHCQEDCTAIEDRGVVVDVSKPQKTNTLNGGSAMSHDQSPYECIRSNISQGDCFIPFDIKQSFSYLVNLLEVKQQVLASVKEIENVQLGIFNQAELKLQPKVCFSIFGILSPLVGEAVALTAEGTFMLVDPDAFSTMVANLFK